MSRGTLESYFRSPGSVSLFTYRSPFIESSHSEEIATFHPFLDPYILFIPWSVMFSESWRCWHRYMVMDKFWVTVAQQQALVLWSFTSVYESVQYTSHWRKEVNFHDCGWQVANYGHSDKCLEVNLTGTSHALKKTITMDTPLGTIELQTIELYSHRFLSWLTLPDMNSLLWIESSIVSERWRFDAW